MTPYSNDAKYVAGLKLIEQQIANHQLGQAAQNLNMLVKLHPHDPRLFLLASRMASAAGNTAGTLQLARRAHQVEPSWPVATLYLADVLSHAGEFKEALSVAAQAVEQSRNTDDSAELLTKAATLARQLGANNQALAWLREADTLQPDNASIRYKIARVLMESGDFSAAIDILEQLLLSQPQQPMLLSAHMEACLAAQKTEQAKVDVQSLLVLDPDNEIYNFYLAFASGQTPSQLPESLIHQLFAADAGQFDQRLVVQSRYQLPRQVAQLIHGWHPDKKADVLDLGCGTGLLGVCLGAMEGVLVGVDLLDEMIEQAQQHRVYDSFHHVNLLSALRATPADLYHVITALDVLSYLGELDTAMAGAFRVLTPGGRFVFSCETEPDNGSDFSLKTNYRYSHGQDYIERLLQNAGFTNITMTPQVLRFDAGIPVQGLLVTACKPPQQAEKSARKSPKSAKKVHSEP